MRSDFPPEREKHCRSEDLAEFDAALEGEQGPSDGASICADTGRAEGGGKAEAVDQSEGEREQPARAWLSTPEKIIDADINDGSGDQGFDDAARQFHDIEGGERESDG